MSLLLLIIGQLSLYFLKNSPDLLVRIKPEIPTQEVILYYNFGNTKWDSTSARSYITYFDAIIPLPETSDVAGFYFLTDGRVNNNKGELFLFEIKKSPRSILPLSLDYLDLMLQQARKKVINRIYIDEAIALIDYVERTLKMVPYLKGSEGELKINLLKNEINELKSLLER